MIDISDGLFNEANLLSKASRVSITISNQSLPISPELEKFCKTEKLNPTEFALFGGEDYELLFGTRENLDEKFLSEIKKKFHIKITPIGVVQKGRGVKFIDENGKEIVFRNKTFKHF